MCIDIIREEMIKKVGKKAKIKYNLGRNKYETYMVKIKECYKSIFIVEDINNGNILSFSYSDIATKYIKISYL